MNLLQNFTPFISYIKTEQNYQQKKLVIFVENMLTDIGKWVDFALHANIQTK